MTRRGLLLFSAMVLIWGVPYFLIKVAVGAVSPAELVFLRTAIGGLVLVPVAAARGQLRPLRPYLRPLLAYTAIEIGVPWLLLSHAETRLDSSLSGLLICATPLAGVVIARTTGERSRVDAVQLGGLLVGLCGVAALLGLDLSSVSLIAVAELAVVVVCYAGGPAILARQLRSAPRLGTVAASLGITAIVYLPAGILQRPSALPGTGVIAAVLTLGTVCTALAFIVFLALIAEVGPVRATVITYLNPVVALAVGVTVLHEPITVGIVGGFALVLCGSYVATNGRARWPVRGGRPTPA